MAIALDIVRLPAAETGYVGKFISNVKINDGTQDTYRQVTSLGSPDGSGAAWIAAVKNTPGIGLSDYGLVTRNVGGVRTATGSITAQDVAGPAPSYGTAYTPTAGSYASFAIDANETQFSVLIAPVASSLLLGDISYDSTDGVNGSWFSLLFYLGNASSGLTANIAPGPIGASVLAHANCVNATYVRIRCNLGTSFPIGLTARFSSNSSGQQRVAGDVAVGTPTVRFSQSSVDNVVNVLQSVAPTRAGFAAAVASGVDTTQANLVKSGLGMTVNQSGGNLNIVGGTTVNAETIVRSLAAFAGDLELKYQFTQNLRLANNSVFVELVDVLGDNLAYSITNSTTVVVTQSGANQIDATTVGQGITIGGMTATTGTLPPPQRAVIAGVSGTAVTLTVVGFPATGAGTCSLFGRNTIYSNYNTASTTQTSYNAQRNGYKNSDTLVTINAITAAPLAVITSSEGESSFADGTGASGTGSDFTFRATRTQNVPNSATPMFWQIRVVNGTTAPATSTVSVGSVDITQSFALPVSLRNVGQMSPGSQMPVQVFGTVGVSVNNTPSVLLAAGGSSIGLVTLNAGGNSIGAVGLNTGANLIGDTGVSARATTNGGTLLRVTSATTNNATLVKASAGRLLRCTLFNTDTTIKWVKFYNLGTTPVPASSTVFFSLPIPINGGIDIDPDALGIFFSAGIGIAIVASNSDTDTASLATTGVVTGFIQYA